VSAQGVPATAAGAGGGARTLRLATFVLALIGACIAAYLTYIHYAGLQPLCLGGGGGCERVQSSQWAELGGLPVAVLGLAGYLGLLGSLALPEDLGRSAAALLSFVGAGFSAWLTYVEIAKIHSICQWCVASAILMFLLAAVSLARVLRVD
jgi:uncharacterized membrane protein